MGMTVVEKILARATGQVSVKAGDVLEPRVDLAMSHENAALVINQFLEIYNGTGYEPKVWDPSRVAIIFDHRVPAESPKTASNQKKIRGFVAKHMITKFHDIRGDVGGNLPPDSPGERVRPAGIRRGRYRFAHHQPWCTGCLCVRHRRDGDGECLGTGDGSQCGCSCHDQSRRNGGSSPPWSVRKISCSI